MVTRNQWIMDIKVLRKEIKNMRKKILNIVIMAVITITAFFVGQDTVKETHMEKMKYAIKNIQYWEITNSGLDLYDFDGNLYQWK